jgi:hypothetical protein
MASGVILMSCNTIEESIEDLSWIIIANQLKANATQQPKEVMYWRNRKGNIRLEDGIEMDLSTEIQVRAEQLVNELRS